MIITAVQKGSMVYVYGEHNKLLLTKSGELHGYTGSSVSVKRAIWFTHITTAARLYLRITQDEKNLIKGENNE